MRNILLTVSFSIFITLFEFSFSIAHDPATVKAEMANVKTKLDKYKAIPNPNPSEKQIILDLEKVLTDGQKVLDYIKKGKH